jgi:ribonuclease HII
MPPTPDLLQHEHAAWSVGRLLIGVDEVGRGPLAGPVVAAAVVFDPGHRGIAGMRDSKQVKRRATRERLAAAVHDEALAIGLGAASVAEIARLNIRRATVLAMRRALGRCRARLDDQAEVVVLVDGQSVPELGCPHETLIGGDGRCHAIAAAAMVAKVVRDRLMASLAVRRPGYGWESNVGYGSAGHIAALRELGMTPHHREQFCLTAVGQGGLWVGSRPASPPGPSPLG